MLYSSDTTNLTLDATLAICTEQQDLKGRRINIFYMILVFIQVGMRQSCTVLTGSKLCGVATALD